MSSLDPHKLQELAGKPAPQLDLKVKDQIHSYITLASTLWGREFRLPTVSYDLKGHTAGYAKPSTNHIQLNISLLLNPDTQEEMLNQTLPHEIAHLIHKQLYPNDRAWHGKNWQYIMVRLGLNPERCHDMPTKPARKTRKFEYTCYACGKTYTVGLKRHNGIQNDRRTFYCRNDHNFLYNMDWKEIT